MKRIALACLLATLMASDCPDDFFDPMDGVESVFIDIDQPAQRELVHSGSIRVEGVALGPVNEVVYTLNGGAERGAIPDGGDRFHANVQDLAPGRNSIVFTARGQEVTYQNGEEVSRRDVEALDSRVVYYTSASAPLAVLVDPDTLTIPQSTMTNSRCRRITSSSSPSPVGTTSPTRSP